jgi:eukaryotic-like serine/threonine-protein kinase
MNEPERQIMSILGEAVEHRSPQERAAFLEEACAGDADRRARVEALLRAYDAAGNFLQGEPPPHAPVATVAEVPITERPGTVIGPYKLLQVIGEGGMGTVFMAEQTQPVQRRVALKVIKAGMDSRQVIARFEAERQALALMDHVNIARVFEAGATEAGLPYFVMELVHGVPITRYCDDNQLTPRERLELLVPVCSAIQHAHQKGIIHRDIKPSNVLVTLYDGKPVAKVIDFGVAKAIEQKLTEKTLFTQYGTMVGTLEYVSPEQAEMSALGVDTRSDVYSLGVLLYELLTGSTPLSHKRVREAAYPEVVRMIKEEEPQKPSTRLSDSGEALASISAQRRMEPAKLTKLVRGELDWIVMKALEKDRDRRYETASGLAMDVRRYLNDETVQACPPSARYRFCKFARRNKAALVTAAAVAVAVLLALAGLARSNSLIGREKQAAEHALQAETRAKEDLRRDANDHRITLAHRELAADNLGRALRLLDECPEDLREWEWDYLKRLCRFDPVVLPTTSEVHCTAFHPGGEQVAAACADGTVKLFDARSGKVLQTLRGHGAGANVFSVAFRPPDGRYLASAGDDRTVRLWDLSTGHEVFQPRPGHVGDYTGMAHAVAFSPDGRHLVAGSDDGLATVWDAADGRAVHRLPEKHEITAVGAAFSPDGRLLATASWGGVLRIWDARTGQLVRKILAHTDRMSAVVFSPDSRRLATAGFDRTVRIWDAATGERQLTLSGHTGVISGLAFSRDGRRLFSSGGVVKTVKIWDALTGREVLDLRGHTLFCHCVAMSRDGLRLASAGGDGTVRIWDATPLKGDEGLESLTCEHDHEVWSVEFSPDGRRIASGTYAGTVRLWDARTGAPLRPLTHPQDFVKVYRVAFSPGGKRLAAAGISRDQIAAVKVWETATGREVVVEKIPERSEAFFVTFDPTGHYLLREGPEHTVQVQDAETGKVVGVVGRHKRQIWGMVFSPNGRHLATASNDETVRVWAWDPARLGQRQEPELKPLSVRVRGFGNRVAFSPDGLRLATGGEGNTVKIWDAKTGEERATLRGQHTGDVYAVAFSRDGRWLATAGEDTTVRLWDAKSWELRRTLRGHTGIVGTLAFSPDSRRLASGSRDRKSKVWDATLWDDKPQGER